MKAPIRLEKYPAGHIFSIPNQALLCFRPIRNRKCFYFGHVVIDVPSTLITMFRNRSNKHY